MTDLSETKKLTPEQKLMALKKQIQVMNSKSNDVSDTILSSIRTKDDSENMEKTLTEALSALNEITSDNKGGLLSDIASKIPFAKKAKTEAHKIIVRNLSLKENVDNIFKAMDSAKRQVEIDLERLKALAETLDSATADGKLILDELDGLMHESEDVMYRLSVESLQRQLLSINLINKQTSDQVMLQTRSSLMMSTNLNEIQPLLKGMLSCQTALAAQTARNARMQKITDVVTETVNATIKHNTMRTNEIVLKTMKQSYTPLIDKETLDFVAQESDKFSKDAVTAIEELKVGMQQYMDVVRHSTSLIESQHHKRLLLSSKSD